MPMRHIQIDVSSDIFDKVISFLEILPKQKINIKIDRSSSRKKSKKESLSNFFRNSPLVGVEIERSNETYKSRIEF